MRRILLAVLTASASLAVVPMPAGASPGVFDASAITFARCDAPGAPTSTVYAPNITRRLGGIAGWSTPFYVQNTGSYVTSVETSFYAFDTGVLVACHKTTALEPQRTVREEPSAAIDLLDDKQYAVIVRSFGAPVAVTVNQLQTSNARVEALSYAGFTTGATTVYVPNVTRRFYGYDVPLIVQNLGSLVASVTAAFRSFDGTYALNVPLSLAPGRSGVIDPDYTPGLVDGTQYAVTLTSDQPIAVVANAHNETIGPIAFSYSGLATGAPTLWAAFAAKGATFSNVVVQNIGTISTTATLMFTPTSGGTAQSFTMPAILPGRSAAFDVRFDRGNAQPGVAECGSLATATCLGDGIYALKITASSPIAAVILPNSSTTGGAYVAASFVTSRALLPVVQRDVDGWTTTMYVQSASATSVAIRYFDIVTGEFAGMQTVPLVPGSAIAIDAATVAGLLSGREYSVSLEPQFSIAVVAVARTTRPGDGLMIYEGTP